LVVIADVDELMRSALHGVMREAGFQALTFASAEEFLNSGEQQRTACFITDIRMRGMSGLDLQSKLNRDRIRIAIIFITALATRRCGSMQALRAEQ